jgi:hypothetical protein
MAIKTIQGRQKKRIRQFRTKKEEKVGLLASSLGM